MMHVRRIENTVLSSNTFLLSDDSSDTCYLIDVGDVDKIVEALPSYGVVKGVFLTHTHFDHIYGINALYHIFPDITVYTSAYGKEAVYSAKKNLSFYHDMPLSFEGHDIRLLAENDTIRLFPDTTLRVLETPGHCPSCLSYIVGQYMFTGDSYIPGKSVISKLPRGNKQLAQESEERIKAVCSQYLICPGHGEIVQTSCMPGL